MVLARVVEDAVDLWNQLQLRLAQCDALVIEIERCIALDLLPPLDWRRSRYTEGLERRSTARTRIDSIDAADPLLAINQAWADADAAFRTLDAVLYDIRIESVPIDPRTGKRPFVVPEVFRPHVTQPNVPLPAVVLEQLNGRRGRR